MDSDIRIEITVVRNVSVDRNPPFVIFVSARAMRNCINISTPSRQPVGAKARRHGRSSQGCVFNDGLSASYGGSVRDTHLDHREASR